jgi:hypothetical protein
VYARQNRSTRIDRSDELHRLSPRLLPATARWLGSAGL